MPELVLKLAVMLAAGLLARHVATRLAARLRVGGRVRIPRLCCYAAAGTAAAVVRLALEHGTSLEPFAIWVVFGAVWGVVIALMLPFSRPRGETAAT